jgi:hypothetical protein
MSEPDEYARAVIRKALEDAGVTGDLGAATDLTYRMLLAGSMLQSAYWPTGYMASLQAEAATRARVGGDDGPALVEVTDQ